MILKQMIRNKKVGSVLVCDFLPYRDFFALCRLIQKLLVKNGGFY